MPQVTGPSAEGSAGPSALRSAKRSPIILLFRLALPVALLIYSVAFFNSISGLRPDSRYYPQFMILLLVPLLLWEATTDVIAWLKEKRPADPVSVVRAWWPSLYVTAVTVIFILSISRIGFYEAIIPFLLLLLPGVGVRRPLLIVVFTVGTVIGMYLLFGVVLGARVPSGFLGL
jgi:hypothetical protein